MFTRPPDPSGGLVIPQPVWYFVARRHHVAVEYCTGHHQSAPAGASGAFTVTAVAAEGTTLTGQTVFAVNVPAKLVCQSGTAGGNPTPTPWAATVPNTAMAVPMSEQLPVALLALIALASVAFIGYRNLVMIKDRR